MNNIIKKKLFPLRDEYDGIKLKLQQLKDLKPTKYENHKNQLEKKYGAIPKLIDKLAKEDIDVSWTKNIFSEHIESVVSASKGGKKSKRSGDWKTLRK